MRIDTQTAEKLLKDGQVVAMPTETVYGLAAALSHPQAIEKIFVLKGRPLNNPLIIHVSDTHTVLHYALTVPPSFKELTEKFWPGPLTLIVPVKEKLIPALVRAHLPTAGFRMPNHPDTLEVIARAGPLVMPSANLSGRPSSTRPEHVEKDFGLDFPVLDGGYCHEGVESTILLFKDNQWVVARLGALPPDSFQSILGYIPQVVQEVNEQKPICPGQLFRHYAPKAKLILGNRESFENAEFIIGFKERHYPKEKRIIYLSSLDNPSEAAENLYHVLRQLDLENAKSAWVDFNFPRTGLWQTIAERLERASEQS
jgi:L-threonylcarbamoyladenylate synthase